MVPLINNNNNIQTDDNIQNNITNGVATKHPYIIGMGNPLLDIICEVPLDFLEKYNLKIKNAILADEKLHNELYSEIENKFNVNYVPGGSTQNSVRICQALIGEHDVMGYIGCIGDDDHGKKMTKIIESEGIKALYSHSDNNPTGVCAVLINNKERSLCTKLCAANDYKINFLTKSNTWNIVKNASIFYSAGFFLTVCHEAMKAIGEICVENNKIFCTSLAAEFIVEFYKEQMMEVLEYADYIFGNDLEYLHFSKIHNFGTENLEEIATKIVFFPKKNKNRKRVVVVTQGSKDVIIATNWLDNDVKISKYPVIPVDYEDILDTNSAGDAFVGGFLYGLYIKKNIDFCVLFAIIAASHIIKRSGCTFDSNVLKNEINKFSALL